MSSQSSCVCLCVCLHLYMVETVRQCQSLQEWDLLGLVVEAGHRSELS